MTPAPPPTPFLIRAATIVVPTLREAAAAPELIDRVAVVRAATGLDLELLFVDDDSRDGIDAAIAAPGHGWLRLIVRSGQRGLATAAIQGIRAASHDTLIVMDADLSHPPESIPALLAALEAGAEMAIGSRFTPGGSTDAEWTLARRLNSALATLLARPFTTLADPMSGLIAFRRDLIRRAEPLNPIGYKIGLELIVRSRAARIVEVPIHFTERRRGVSKLSATIQAEYLLHLGRLAAFRLFGRTR